MGPATMLERTHAYLDALPAGLDSYPSCTAKASIARVVHDAHGAEIRGLPGVLHEALTMPAPHAAWIRQVHVLALILAMVETAPVDRALEPRLAEMRWIHTAAFGLFSTPMYRILMQAASPRMLVKGAGIRWKAFFRGSVLRSEMHDVGGLLHLESPPGLFNEDLAHVFVYVMRAALASTVAACDDDAVELEEFTAGHIVYRAII